MTKKIRFRENSINIKYTIALIFFSFKLIQFTVDFNSQACNWNFHKKADGDESWC